MFTDLFSNGPLFGAALRLLERARGVSAAVDAALATVDAAEVRRALAVFEGLAGQVSVMYLQERDAKPTYTMYATTAAELDQAVRDVVKADLASEPLGIYVRGTTVREGVSARGKSEDAVMWPGFKSDLDLAKPNGPATWPDLFDVYDTANLPTPTFWQHSGGGFYPWWQLVDPIAHGPEAEALAADIEAELRRAWNAAGYAAGVDSCRDAARVWRLPGSVHRKDRANQLTSTIGKVSGEAYTFAELRARVPVQPASRGFDGERSLPRKAREKDFNETYVKSLAAVRERGLADFRHTFFLAARNAHRMEAIGLRTRVEISDELLDLVRTYWPNAEFDGDDLQHIHDALNNPLALGGSRVGALASPWELVTDEPASADPPPVTEPASSGDAPEVDSWAPMDLTPYVDGTVERPETAVGAFRRDGLRFFYPGLEHAVIGETEGGKTWFLLASAAAELEAGNRVVYVHFEENDPNSTVRRLLDQFGVSARRLLDDFLFIGPERQIPPGKIEEICAQRVPTFVVLDGQNEAMALHGQGINDPDGAAEFRRKLVKPWTRHGCAVAAADHVVKDPDRNGSGYALGSVHKLNGLSGAGFLVENREAFGEGLKGNSGIYVVKDRPGRLRKAGRATKVARKYHVAEMVIDDTGDGWEFHLYAPQDESEVGIWAEAAEGRKERDQDNRVFEIAAELIRDEDVPEVSSAMVLSKARGIRRAFVFESLNRLLADKRLTNESLGRGARYGLPPESVPAPDGSHDQVQEQAW